MPKTELVNPNVGNFIESIRDIGYSFEVAVADLIDNSLTAGCSDLQIVMVPQPELVFSILDNGAGMIELELVEAMRLATRNPKEIRSKNDLGRFGLGLKTASFSQCRKLTVVSKKNETICCRQWDLFKLQNIPHRLRLETALPKDDIKELTERQQSTGFLQSYIDETMKTEIYIN